MHNQVNELLGQQTHWQTEGSLSFIGTLTTCCFWKDKIAAHLLLKQIDIMVRRTAG